MLAGGQQIVDFHVIHSSIQQKTFQDFPNHWCKANRSVFSAFCLWPFLWIRVMFVFFHASGKIPSSSDLLKISVRGSAVELAVSFCSRGWTLSGPADWRLQSSQLPFNAVYSYDNIVKVWFLMHVCQYGQVVEILMGGYTPEVVVEGPWFLIFTEPSSLTRFPIQLLPFALLLM